MARDILDHVVDGPEADRTWQAYQVEGERLNDTDEEEMEEQLLGERIWFFSDYVDQQAKNEPNPVSNARLSLDMFQWLICWNLRRY